MVTRPVSLTVSPGGAILPVGDLNGSLRVVVSNTGSDPVTVRITKTVVTSTAQAKGCDTAKPPQWLAVVPSVMHLKPRQSGYATMTVHAPRTLHGTVDTVAVFTATDVITVVTNGKPHNVGLADSVGAQLVVRGTGRAAPIPRCGKEVPRAAPYHPPAQGFPVLAAIAVIVVAAMALLAAVLIFGRRMHRRIHG